MKAFFVVISMFCLCCTPTDEWQGEWKAQWIMSKELYPDLTHYVFEMEGTFHFQGENLTVSTFGFENCVFQSDTSTHTQKWKETPQYLQLLNQNEKVGIQYLIKSKSKSKIVLQLLDDITIILTK